MRNFGENIAGIEYLVRPSAWVVILDEHRRVLTVEFHGYHFLPGGGIEKGETAHEAIDREVAEEIGWRVNIGDEICRAGQYLYAEMDGKYFYKDGLFYSAQLTEQIAHPDECEHRYLWLAPIDFKRSAAHESHIYAVDRAIRLAGND